MERQTIPISANARQFPEIEKHVYVECVGICPGKSQRKKTIQDMFNNK